MIENFNSYEGLFACEELNDGIREYIMSVAYEYKCISYRYGPDYDEKYVKEHSYYTKKDELIATICAEGGEYSLKTFNNCIVKDWEKTDIQKKVDELEKERKRKIEKVFGYLEMNSMSYELKKILKRDCFTVSIDERDWMFSQKIVVQMRNKRFEVMYTCDFYTNENNYERGCEACSLRPWEDDCDGKILNSPGVLVVGVAGELNKRFSTEWSKEKGDEYKYAISHIPKWYIKESGLTLTELRRPKKEKLGWFRF